MVNLLDLCRYFDDLRETIPGICETLDKVKVGLGVSHKDKNPVKVGNAQQTELTLATLNDFVLYLHDTTLTLISFLNTLPSLCQHFFKGAFVQKIALFYEEAMPIFEQRYRDRKSERTFLNKVKFGLIKICRFIIDAHCLVPLMNG